MMVQSTSSTSPVCVIHAAAHQQHPEDVSGCYPFGFPNLARDDCKVRKKASRKRVRVAETQPTTIPNSSSVLCSEEEIRNLWLSKAELRQNCHNAKRDICKVQFCDPDYLQVFLKTFQSCSTKKANLAYLLMQDGNVRCLMQGSTTHIRGLEAKATHKALSQYRRLHVLNVLQAQQNCGDVLEDTSEMLRSVSVQTSRTSRMFARVLGHMDEYQLNVLLQQELTAKC